MATKLSNTSIDLIGALIRAGYQRADKLNAHQRMSDLDRAHVELGLGRIDYFNNQRKDDNERG